MASPTSIRLAVVALFAEGHVLIEDVPGVGKTLLARALAASIDCSFRRIQFTPDLLPSDVLGSSVYHAPSGEFVFKPGPLFANVILADEINRTTPRTQSALLEAMSDRQVSVEGKTYPLDPPFIVLATQNPYEFEGTYVLPGEPARPVHDPAADGLSDPLRGAASSWPATATGEPVETLCAGPHRRGRAPAPAGGPAASGSTTRSPTTCSTSSTRRGGAKTCTSA